MLNHRMVWLTLAALAVATPVHAADWPQWLGPDRNGVSNETGLLKQWPKGGPQLKWKATNIGEGYSAPAVANGRIYLLGTKDNDEHVIALDEKDGTPTWSAKVGKRANAGYPGPRGTPTVDGDKLYALGSAGDLVCVELTKGDVIWSKNLARDFGGKPGSWAYSESPLVDGDVVVVSPGGKNATVVALHKQDGQLAWKSAVPGGDNAAYGSPIRIEAAGLKQYVCFLSNGLVGLAAADGKFLWRYNNPANGTANIPTPVFHDGHVFGVSGYGVGGGVVKLEADSDKVTASQVWFSKEMVSQIGGFLRVGDYLYGAGGGKGGGPFMCVEFTTGKIVWRNPSVGSASLCVAGGMLYVRGHGGNVALVEASPTAYNEHGRFNQPDRSNKPAWPYPVVANGCLYLRDQGVLLCYDVREPDK
jgi:outer membrane protein assembly factor BamB